jgi:hypothetical protein
MTHDTHNRTFGRFALLLCIAVVIVIADVFVNVHGKRSARNHLRWVAQQAGLPASRVDEVLEIVGLADVAAERIGDYVHVVSPDAAALRALLEGAGGHVSGGAGGDGTLAVLGLGPARIGDLAAEHGLRVHELTPRHASLEAAFMELTQDTFDCRPLEAS